MACDRLLGGEKLLSKEKLIDGIKEHKLIVLAIGVILLLVVAIVLILNINNTVDNIQHTDEEDLPPDIHIIHDIVEKCNTNKEVEIISNKNNDQADVILDDLGIDIKQLYTYAAAVNLSDKISDSLIILRPKEENYSDVLNQSYGFVISQQVYYNDLVSKGYADIKEPSSLIYEKYGYIIVATNDDPNKTILSIVKELDNNFNN